jgi:hypothetical protein
MKALRRELEQGGVPMSAWRKSSFSDTPNSCVEVRHESDVVYVRDSKLGEDSPVQEWPLTYWEFLCDAIVADLPRFSGFRKLDDGGVELRWAHIHPAPLIFDAGEWKAFVLGVRAGEFDPDRLTERFQSSSSRRGVAEEDREGSDSAAGPDQAATGAGVPASPPAPVAAQPRLWHMGRAWSGHEIEDACPCEQEPCGLVATPDPECVQHSRAKTIRQSHPAESCPALGAGITWINEDVPAGRHDEDPAPPLGDSSVLPIPTAGRPGLIQYEDEGSDRSRGMCCGQCDQYTGNFHQGDLAAAWRTQYEILVERFAELGVKVDDTYASLISPVDKRWRSLVAAAKAIDDDAEAWTKAVAPLVPAVETQETVS